ncbi:MAG TPA: hypothetical protein VGJ09_07015 [Bryobacteraceae bacterium]|jgi:hypothetical protein
MSRIVLLALLTAGAALAQTHGYFLAAPGIAHSDNDTLGLVHLGVGGEYVFKNTYGAGAEIGVLGRTDLGAAGIVSVNGYYHFPRHDAWAPFVTAGYTNVFEFGGGNGMANMGGGVNYWYKSHLGLKFEFRDHFGSNINYAEFRFGVNFK